MDHVVQFGDFLVFVRQNRVVHAARLGFVDVADPAFVGFSTIDGERDRLYIALVELRFQLSHHPQLSGANGGVVSRVGEQNHPAITGPLVEIDGSFRGVLGEIGNSIA